MAEPPPSAGRVAGWFDRAGWRQAIVAAPYLWLAAFFLAPFLIVVAMSLATRAATAPPFAFAGEWPFVDLTNFRRLAEDPLYARAFLISVSNALLATAACLLIGYPMALALTRVRRAWRTVLLMLVILPFWTSFLLRVYAWMGLMGSQSWFNEALTWVWNAAAPADWALRSIPMMNSNFAVVLVTVYTYLPFMILPLYAYLEKLDPALNEAGMDLGSPPWKVFRDVTLPLSVPGIVAGALLVFIPAAGELIIPTLVGDAGDPMIGRVINDEFSLARDWPMASAASVALLALLVGPMMLHARYEARTAEGAPR
jgi:putrescine transport system permease protein